MQATMLKTAMDVGQEMVRAKPVGLNGDHTHALMLCYMNEQMGQPVDGEIEGRLAYQIMMKRCRHHGISVTPWTLALIALLVDRPGSAMLYVAALHYISRKSAAGTVNLDRFIDFFGDGFPGEDELRRIWEGQKSDYAPLGNVLDDPQAWA